VDPELQNSHFR